MVALLILSLVFSSQAMARPAGRFEQKDPMAVHHRAWLHPTCSMGVNTPYSVGYRRGRLTGFTESWRSWEGYHKIGRPSSAVVSYEEDLIQKISPWKFSMSKRDRTELFDKQRLRSGDELTLRYVKYMSKSFSPNALSETDYRVVGAEKVNAKKFRSYFEAYPIKRAKAPINFMGDAKESFGEIVKASQKGRCFKTYEVVFSAGMMGDEFVLMSIQDPELYDYAVAALRAGIMVRIHYAKVDSFSQGFTRVKTNRIIYSIEAVPEPQKI